MDESTVFVGGVDWKANERTLQKFFEQEIGTVLNCKIIVNRDNGHSKGYGFVTFENAELALKAKSAPKLEFMNKQLNVDKAIRRQTPSSSGSKTSARRSMRGRTHHGDRSRASIQTRKPRSSAGSEGTASCASQMSYLSASPEGGVAGCDNEDAGEVVPESRSNDDDKARQSPTRQSSCCSMSTPPLSPVVVVAAAEASVGVVDSPRSGADDPAPFREKISARPAPAEFHPGPYPPPQQQQQRPQQAQPRPQPLPQQHGHLHPAMQAPAFMPMPMPFGQPMPYAAHPPFMPMPQYFLPPNYYYAPYSMQHIHMGHPMHHHVPPMQSPYAPYFYVDEEGDVDDEFHTVGPHSNRSAPHYHIDELSEQMQSSNI